MIRKTLISKTLITGLVAGFMALSLAGCDICCGDADTSTGGAAVQSGDTCAECIGCEDEGTAAVDGASAGLAGDVAADTATDASPQGCCPAAAEAVACDAAAELCGDEALECGFEQACEDKQVEDCSGGQCDAPAAAPKVTD